MAKRNLDWHIGWWTEPDDFLTTTYGTQAVLTLTTAQEVLDYEDDLIVERVVGQIYVRNSSSTAATFLHMRMSVRPENEVSIFTLDTTLALNAQEAFMWHKVHRLDATSSGVGATNLSPIAHPEWSHIDCRVNRKVADLDRLILSVECFGYPLGAEDETIVIGAWLRVLVKT